jgi:hypothetical protein
MKIAIQGHPTRGKEVIQILESWGGINQMNYEGGNSEKYYYIARDSIITVATAVSSTYTKYTLKELEEEFPFKIGDRVISITTGCIGTITKCNKNGCCYVKYDNGNIACAFGHYLKLYKEMERNITLTLDKAKEWYKKGGELKEIALQAFTERELNPLPRSWEEYCRKHKSVCLSTRYADMPLKYDALIKLEQLRNCWWNGWEPEWNNCEKYVIKWDNDDLIVFTARNIRAFLVFPTREMAYEFLKCFRYLIEQAKDLI